MKVVNGQCNYYFQKPRPRTRIKHTQGTNKPEEFIFCLPYDFEHGDRPHLSMEEHQGISSLRHTFPTIASGLRELNPANRDDLCPAYYAYRTGSLSGTFNLVNQHVWIKSVLYL